MNTLNSWLLLTRGIAGVVCWTLACGVADAQAGGDALVDQTLADESVVVYADGKQQRATLTAWDGQTLTIQTPDDAAPQTLPMEQLLRYGPTVPSEFVPVQTPRSVWLVDGSRLAARWLEVDQQSCRVANDWCRVSIPLERVQAIQLNGPLDAAAWQRIAEQLHAIDGADDAIVMVGGEVRRGRVGLDSWQAAAFAASAILDDTGQGGAGQGRGLRFEWAERSVDVALGRVRVVVPSPVLRQRVTESPGDVWLGAIDGSRLRVRKVDGQGRWHLACGQALEKKATVKQTEWLRSLAVCDPVPGLLAAEQPLRYRAVPVFGQPRPLRQWTVGGSNGIEVAATSRLVFRVDGAQRLRGKVLVPAVDEGAVQAACQFTIQSAAGGKVTTHWQSEPLSAGKKSVQSFDVPLDAGGLLILGSDSVSGGDRSRPIWLDTILVESP
ncbi:hypothetical protein [Roseimaritima ulvae]|uniref:NPCBM/NEW2 domain protein n=1 Tax=Roseimaritima ulvae TaxID=980254 RepID=A0A5B9QW77_9BACT|nr:hypothetical protein [Roseimaritima ulvae]QEG43298.1 hypothetical protein UC8_53450 [Roseimaritima ulvae]